MGLSRRAYAKKIGVSEAAVRKAIQVGRISVEGDGTIDPAKADRAWRKNTDPDRQRANLGAQPGARPETGGAVAIENLEEARAAVSLIRQVLRDEGREIHDELGLTEVKMAEGIIRARSNALDMEVRNRGLVPKEPVVRHVADAFASYRKELQALPARYGAQIAAEVGCDVKALDRALSEAIREHLEGLSAPVVRG